MQESGTRAKGEGRQIHESGIVNREQKVKRDGDRICRNQEIVQRGKCRQIQESGIFKWEQKVERRDMGYKGIRN